LALGVCLWLGGNLGCQRVRDSAPATCSLDVELVDRESGAALSGMIQVVDDQGVVVPFSNLLNRGQGIDDEGAIHRWWVLPRRAKILVPAAPIVVRAFAGLETEMAELRIDLTGQEAATRKIALSRFADTRRDKWLAGNTHLHLKKLSKAEADRYLSEVPLGDGLDVVFLSYLERADADLDYTSNKYSREDLRRLSHEHLHLGHGEEHRHNFDRYGEGYGHILLLDIPIVIRPVSIGAGLTGRGPDAPAMQVNIDKARQSGGKVVWAHNMYGFEDIPNWITGRVHANNIYDGSERGSYKDTYYRYLNIGLQVPFSTGTDWFIYDFSRAYVLTEPDRPITPTEWLDRLAAGQSYITNGPLLDFTVDGRPLSSVLDLAQPREVKVRGRAIGRHDFRRVELIHNGQIVHAVASRAEGGHFVAELNMSVMIDAPAWLALRTPPRPVAGDPALQEAVSTNELGGGLFSHTSPIYVHFAGRGVFDRSTAQSLIDEMQANVQAIIKQAVFETDEQRHGVLAVYEEAIKVLTERLASPP